MIITVFRSRLNNGVQEEYTDWAIRISELAKNVKGYISHKAFVAEDGERVTIVEFENEESLSEWAHHPEHIKAKKMGVQEFYSEYSVHVCEVKRNRRWQR